MHTLYTARLHLHFMDPVALCAERFVHMCRIAYLATRAFLTCCRNDV